MSVAEAMGLWERALGSLHAAEVLAAQEPDSCASRAYYAAFNAVSALFALSDRAFRKHNAVEAAVHRDLVKAGKWSESLGADYSWLVSIRDTGDYGGEERVTAADAKLASCKARGIIEAVHAAEPDAFPLPEA
jgi:uncharacterized protein (UPF0332 family)